MNEGGEYSAVFHEPPGDGPTRDLLIEGGVTVPAGTTQDEIVGAFIDFVEARGWGLTAFWHWENESQPEGT